MCPLLLVPPVSLSGVLQFAWVDPGGTVRDLTQQTSPTRFVSKGATGLGGPSVELSADKKPFAPGKLVRHIGTQEGRIELPITILEDSLGDLIAVLDDMRGWFDTGDEASRTPGYLRVTRPDGTVRQLACYYAGGLEGDLSTGGPNGTTVVVSLYAPDPWPTDEDDTVLVYGQADFGSEIIIINPGQLQAYPIWKITGPFTTSITIQNTVTNKLWQYQFSLGGGGAFVTTDTRPADQRPGLSCTRFDGLNLYPFLSAQSSLWWLAPGENRFQIGTTGTDANTEVELRYLPRYRGLLR